MYIYFLLIRIASLWNDKARRLLRGQRATLSLLQERLTKGHWVWFHASSVGEFEQGRPIMERLRRERPELKILLTFFSPSGYELRKDWHGADIITYLPFATRRNARRFLNIVKPEKAVFIKYEFWPAYLKELRKRGIATYSVASVFRPEQFFFRPIIGKPYLSLLHCFTHLLVQDEASKELLAEHGVENVTVCGDPRFNRVAQIASEAKEIPLVDRFTSTDSFRNMMAEGRCTKILVAGSTWVRDEELLNKYIVEHDDVRLVLVPHETDERHIQQIFRIFEGRYIRLSEATLRNVDLYRVLVVDEVGMLSSIYRYATVAYIGGGFGKGIHNTLEAAAYGVPVVWGKNYKRFREAKGLIAAGAGFAVSNYAELREALDNAFMNAAEAGKRAREYVLSETDAAERIYNMLFNV